MPDVEVWSVNSLANISNDVATKASDTTNVISNIGFNLGAAGDRHDDDGMLWLEYPNKSGESPGVTVEFNSDAKVFKQHSASRGDDPRAWISASGIDNLSELTIRLNLANKVDLSKGIPVSHANDDAEESSAGNVSLSSSDLELTDDGGDQTIGLRFASVPLPTNYADHIKEAYIQFTVDEPSDRPTALWISGELSADSERFSASSHDVTSRDRTTEQVTWSPPAWNVIGESGLAQRTPDLTRIMREIVSQPKWKAGNAISFIIGGEGKRVAVSSRGGNEKAARLVIVSDREDDSGGTLESQENYEVELIFASPRGSTETRRFDVYAQGEPVAMNVEVKPSTSSHPQAPTVVSIPRVAIGETLSLQFAPKNGQPLLSGIGLRKLTSESN